MIIYFSGTGNSRLVAEQLHKCFYADDVRGEMLYELSGDRLLRPNKQLINLESAPYVEDNRVIWVFPIYSWGVPPIVLRFIDKVKLKGGDEARHFMVCTCGDDIGRADDQWRKHLGRRGWTPRGAFSVIMPNTYVCMKGFDVDSPELEARKLAAMPARIDEIAEAIRRGYSDSDVTRGSWAWWKTNLVYGLFRAFEMSPAPFRAEPEKCSSCGLCARSCPMMNIRLQDGRPQWGPACTMCLRCYHHCPTKAIAYGKQTADKGQYRPPRELD